MPPRSRAERRTALLALAVGVLTGGAVVAEQPEFGPARLVRPAPAQPAAALFMTEGVTAFDPLGVSSRVRRTLLQYEALVADGAWDEAIELIERLQTEAGAELTSVPSGKLPLAAIEGHERFVPIAERCQQLLSALPPEGLAVYRARVDRSARERLDEATAKLDTAEIEKLVHELQASEPAADALLALGELALERGDYAASRRWHMRLHPLLWDPYGRPAGMSLALIDPGADPAALAKAWREAKRPEGLSLVTVDDELLPLALSRLALTSIREGDLRRAAAETRLLQALAPDAEGRIAGRVQPLAPALEAMLAEGRSHASPAPHWGELAWAWPDAVEIEKGVTQAFAPQENFMRMNAIGQIIIAQDAAGPPEVAAPPTLSAAVHGLSAYFVEAGELKRLDLATGEKHRLRIPDAAGPSQRGRQPEPGDIAAGQAILRRLAMANGANAVMEAPAGVFGRPMAAPASPARALPFQIQPGLSISQGVLYAQIGPSTWSAQMPPRLAVTGVPEELVAIQLDDGQQNDGQQNDEQLGDGQLGDGGPKDDRPAVRFSPPKNDAEAQGPGVAGMQFVSAPTVVGDRLYVALARLGTRSEIAAACYATRSGRLLWKTDLGSGDAAQRMPGVNASAPVAVGDTLYVATNLGAVTALDAATGRVRWIARYPRQGQPMMRYGVAPPPQQQMTKCVVVGDQVIAAPSDSSRLLAWDTATGAPLWDADRPRDSQLVGVVRNEGGSVIVLAGRQLASYDTLTGQRRLLWPESPRSGLRGLGEAAIVGDEVFWPTREAIFAIDPVKGGLTRTPIDLAPLGGAGANVFATDYGLLVCGAERLRLLARVEAMAPPELPSPVSRLSRGVPRISQLTPQNMKPPLKADRRR